MHNRSAFVVDSVRAVALEVSGVNACDCLFQTDFDGDGYLDAIDLDAMIIIIYSGATSTQDPACPAVRADFNGDGQAD